LELWIGAGLACVGIAVGIGQWLIPADELAPRVRSSLIAFACASGLIGLGLLGFAFLPHKVEQFNAKPHIAMTPDLKLIEGQATVMVMFHNRGKEDVDKLTFKILLNDGEKFNENLREVPILRADINRKLFVMIPQDLYNALIAGKEPLKVTASVAYSLHGTSYIESCVMKWNALMRTFDYIDC
jgi:hypothetical protein